MVCAIDEFQCYSCGRVFGEEPELYQHIWKCPLFLNVYRHRIIDAPFYHRRSSAQLLYQLDKKLWELEDRVAKYGEDPGVDNRGSIGGGNGLRNSPLIHNRLGDIQ